MGKITFIVGGARSGKSSYALLRSSGAKKPAFVATCQALDGEMKERIRKHKAERSKKWTTFEEPRNVSGLIRLIGDSYDVILLDCLTLLISNLLLKKASADDIEREISNIIKAAKKRKGRTMIVSNEVGLGIVPGNRLSRDFRDAAGNANKAIAQAADHVFFMVSGIPWRIK